jgi:aspartyl-tRNA(Asn)/glutamyl-tRNA(Gln) amidotransferase subunit A
MELFEQSVRELQTLLKQKATDPKEITASYLKRIAAVEPEVQAFRLLLADEARHRAETLPPRGDWLGVAGIPYGLKDNMCTKGVETTCGSRILEGFIPHYEAFVARRLREAEGVLLGKLNMDEFAMGSSNENSAYHMTYNPWDLRRVPGGSSGGSAAAVAAGEVAFALGSDTGGSIRQPAAFCGVVGIKPTYGRVSRFGVVSMASSLDQTGVLARTTEDCAAALQIIAGHDRQDSNCADVPVPDYSAALTGDVKGLKIGFPQEYFGAGVRPEVREAVLKALKQYETLGAIVEEVSLPHSAYALPAYYVICPAEVSANLAMFDGVRYGRRNMEAETVNEMFATTRSRYLGAEVKKRIMLGTYTLSAGYYEAYYLKALKVRRLVADDFERVFADFDVVVTPTTPQTAFEVGEYTDSALAMMTNDILVVPVNMAGLPAVTLPCGFNAGLPIGMQIIGRPFAETTILQAAHAFEQQTEYHLKRPLLGA